MLTKINLNLLRSLKVLLEECHVSQAANKLNITQSALSRQLAQLREVFADPLLVRDGNKQLPTPKALELQTKLNSVFSEIETLMEVSDFDPFLWSGEFTLASSDYVAQYILPEIMQAFNQKTPKLSLNYKLWQSDYLELLANSDIQLASTMLPESPVGLSSIQIGKDYPVCVMSKDHPLAIKDQLLVDDLLEYAHISVTGGGDKDSYLDQALAKLGHHRRIVLKVPFFSSALSSLCRSEHLMVLPEHIARNLQRHLPICYKALPMTTQLHKYWLIWHPKYDEDPSHQWARKLIKQVMDNSQYSIGYK